MKKSKIILLTALLALVAAIGAGSASAFAETENTGIAHMVITGSAEAHGKADECVLNGAVEVMANDMCTAESRCGEALKKVREAFQPYGEACENYYSAYPMYDKPGYIASCSLSFTTEKVDALQEIREKLTEAGVSRLDGVCFRLKDDSSLKAQALRLAVENAKAKAQALGCTGELLSIEELSCYSAFRECRGGENADNGVTYTANVRAIFATRPPERRHEQQKTQQEQPVLPDKTDENAS